MQEVEIDSKDKFEIIKWSLNSLILDNGREMVEPVDPDVELEDSGLSVSDYKPSKADDNEVGKGDIKDTEELDTEMTEIKEQKKEKPGIVSRNQICLIREQEAVNDNHDTLVHKTVKCKASLNMHANFHLLLTVCIISDHPLLFRSSVSKKSKVVILIGVLLNWDKDNVLLCALIAKSNCSASASSFSSQQGSHDMSSNFDVMMDHINQFEDAPAFQHHRIISDDDDKLKHQAVVKQAARDVHFRVCVLSSFK